MGNCIGRTLNLKFRRERGKDIFVPRGEPPCGVAPYGTAFADMPNLRTEGFEEICEYEVRRPGSLFHVIYYWLWRECVSSDISLKRICLFRENVSSEKMSLQRILRRENISEDISLKRKCI